MLLLPTVVGSERGQWRVQCVGTGGWKPVGDVSVQGRVFITFPAPESDQAPSHPHPKFCT